MRLPFHLTAIAIFALSGVITLPTQVTAQCAPDEQDIVDDPIDNDPGTATVTAAARLDPPAASSVCFQGGRGAAVLGEQPDLLFRRDLRQTGPLATQDGGDGGGFGGPVWANIAGRQADLNDNELKTTNLSLGSDLYSTNTTILGVMLQGDTADQDGVTTNSFEATGYMAGIYGIYQITDFTFDGRILAGQAETDVFSGSDTAEGIESTRWLATLQISSQRELSGGAWFLPRVSLGWLEDRMDAYDIGGDSIDEQVVSYGQADIGASFLVPVSLGATNGNVVLGGTGIWAFGEDADSQVPPDLRGRFDLGLELFDGETWSVSGKIFADGFGDEDYVSVGADLGVMFWF